MIGIINYGSGNVHAIANLHKRADLPHIISSDSNELKNCTKLILPGVGAFDETMLMLAKNNLIDYLNEEVVVNKKPIIGFCVGMQILGESSEEGTEKGFGWIKGHVKKFNPDIFQHKPHLPHLGWNSIEPKREHFLLKDVDLERGFYYLHSYYFESTSESNVLASTHYGHEFACLINHENVFGAQFHPEKSHENGVRFFKNYYNF